MGRSLKNVAHDDESPHESHEPVMHRPYVDDANRIVLLHGEVNEHSMSQVVAYMLQLASMNHRKPIQLVISTYGGAVDEMFSLYDVIKFIPCDVQTIALGKCMSAGVALLASGEKGKRLIGASTRVMLHSVVGVAQGNVFDVQNQATEQRRVHDMMMEILLKETSMSRQVLEDIMKRGQDVFLTAHEAIELGIADKILGS